MLISVSDAKFYLNNILLKNNVSLEKSKIITDILIEGDLRGYPSHGMIRIIELVEGLNLKNVNVDAETKIVKKTNGLDIWNANGGVGQIVGHYAMLEAINKASSNGIGFVGVLNASHLGVLSYYSELAASRDCIGIVMSTSAPLVSLNGGSIRTFGTNPISFSIPYDMYHITADFSTSRVSRGKIVDALAKGIKIPFTWAVDINGNPTDEPKSALMGSLKSFDDGHKATCLSFLISVLAGPFIGGVSNDKVVGPGYSHFSPNKGDVFIAIKIDQDLNLDFKNYIKHFANFINIQNSSFKIPGDNEFQFRKKTLSQGISISSEIFEFFKNYGFFNS